ncbi:MAG: hypothetical protein WBG35_02470 [Acidobacteriaceae bacterium]
MVGLNGIKPNGQKYWRDNRDRLLRPMDATDLIKMLQNHYEQLQDEEKALLPLKRVFVPFNFDEESAPAKNLHYKNSNFGLLQRSDHLLHTKSSLPQHKSLLWQECIRSKTLIAAARTSLPLAMPLPLSMVQKMSGPITAIERRLHHKRLSCT